MSIPGCLFEHVGIHEDEARKQGVEVDTFVHRWSDVDRAITDGDDEGFVKIYAKKGTEQILGGTIVARHAGEMISEVTLAMVARLGLGTLANVIHPYPTQADALRRVAFQYSVTRVTPLVKRLLRAWLTLTG